MYARVSMVQITQQRTVTGLQMESKRQTDVLTRRQRLLALTQQQLKTTQKQLLEVMASARKRESLQRRYADVPASLVCLE